MSKKNLARTLIEGGRRAGNTYERKQGTVRERVASKHYCKMAILDEETPQPITRRWVPWPKHGFADRLAPLRKWLESHNGEPWDDVFSLLCRRFDRRRVDGWHLIDHAKAMVNRSQYWRGLPGVDVSEDGLLALKPWRQGHGPKKAQPKTPTAAALFAWSKERLVREVGSELFWAVPRSIVRQECTEYRCPRDHVEMWDLRGCLFRKGLHRQRTSRLCQRGVGSFRQDVKLTPSEVAFWGKLSPRIQAIYRWKK